MVVIISWNINKTNQHAQTALHHTDALGADVLLLQEITKTKSGDAPGPASGKYYKLWAGEGRLAGYVSKKLPLSCWEYTAEKDLVHITIHTQGPRPLHIFGVYSEPFTLGRPWDSPLSRLADQPHPGPDADVVLMGDVNLHHPLWDTAGRTSTQADVLLHLTDLWDLSLLTPPGTPTWQPKGGRSHHRPSTIDHTWASPRLQATHSVLDWPGSDHMPQVCSILTTTPPVPADGFCWARLDQDKAAALGRSILLPTPPPPTCVATLERQTDDLIGKLTGIMHACVPAKSPPRGQRFPGWDAATAAATDTLRTAERRVRAGDQSAAAHDAVREARRAQRRALRQARSRHWRAVLYKASAKDADLWRLEKWARSRSHAPSAPPLLPPLRRPDGTHATHVDDKAEILSRRFFPTPDAAPPPPLPAIPLGRIFISQHVSLDDVSAAVHRTSPTKAPGPDQISNALLRACGDSLFPWLRNLAAASLRLGYWPSHFKASRTIIIPKPGKTGPEKQDAKGWRPIALLSTVGKVIETIVARKLTDSAEENHLLPEGQMGNRRYRSTELAARLLTDAVRCAWSGGATASLLQLDIQGAFDNVHHGWLIYTLHTLHLPAWLLTWVASYLTGRTTSLAFDGKTAPTRHVTAGVPQGSPLSPILFILFTSPLYQALRHHNGIITLGFADDTNLLASGRTTRSCCYRLQGAWTTVMEWARPRGVIFEPAKSELLHFSRTHTAPTATLTLDQATVLTPCQTARFLGIWLDRKLLFSEHLRQIKRRLTTQSYALTRLTGKTWGCTLPWARTIYTAVLRSTVAYGASVFLPEKGNRRLTTSLDTIFYGYLRTVLGAYKSTPIHLLHSEAGIPPLHLYLSYRRAVFLARPDYQTKAQAIRGAVHLPRPFATYYAPISAPPPPPSPGETDWAAIIDQWKASWQHDADSGRSAGSLAARTPCWTSRAVRRRHLHLTKAESSLLTQIRTGHIGLRAYLYRQGAVDSPMCICDAEDETPDHVLLSCTAAPRRPADWPQTLTDLDRRLQAGPTARPLLRWLIRSGRLPEYRLASELERSPTPA